MKKPGEFDVAGQVEWHKQRKLGGDYRTPLAKLLAAAIFFSSAWMVWLSVKPPGAPQSDQTFTVSGSGISYTIPTVLIDVTAVKAQAVTDAAIVQGFRAAVKAWASALGGTLPIRYPRLVKMEDAGFCSSPTILAYADPEMNRIVFCRSWNADPETLMLHEIGHLLGVPHIQQDPLMDEYEHGMKLRAPSSAAIALAKLAHPGKGD